MVVLKKEIAQPYNDGAASRIRMFKGSKIANFIVPLMFDVSGIINLIPDRAELQLRYFRNSPEYFLMVNSTITNKKYVVKLESATFRMIRYHLTAAELARHNSILNSGLRLAAMMQQIKRKTFLAGEQTLQFLCYQNILPEAIFIWFTSLKAANGDYHENPHKYILPKIRRLTIFKNEIPYPLPQGLVLNETARRSMQLPYFYLMRMLHGGSPTFMPAHMAKGYGIFCFDMTAGNTSNSSIMSKIESGTIRIEVDLEEQLIGDPIVMFVQGMFRKNVKIQGDTTHREISIVDLL